MSTVVEEIRITNIGPVSHAVLPFLAEGGVVVLRGAQGVGKSITLNALECAATGKGKVPVKDGELRGTVEAFGVTMTIGKSTRRSGEPEVVSLEGKLSAADLVDPGIAAPEAADSRRIKALIQLANVKPSADLFYRLVIGGREQFETLVSAATLESDDLVVMAERIKRDLEAKARTEESQAEHAEGRARGAREAAADVDVSAEADSDVLQTALEGAIREESTLKSQADTTRKATQAAKLAKDQLEDAEAKYDGPTLAELRQTEDAAMNEKASASVAFLESQQAVRDAQAALDAAKATLKLAEAKLDATKAAHEAALEATKQANQREATLIQWRDQIAASIPAAPPAEQLTDASERVTRARQAVEQGALVRKAKQHLADDQQHRDAAQAHRKKAHQLREAAKGTDDVLSEVVAKTGSPLRVEAGRLVLATARAKKTLFAELSDGERWKLALDIAIDAVGDRGFLTIPQWAWGELQPANRKAIAEHLRERGVLAYTAEASDGEGITAEEFTL